MIKTNFILIMMILSTLMFAIEKEDFDERSKYLFEKSSPMIGQIEVIEKISGKRSSIGSGFYINNEGYVATNYHVINNVVLHNDKYLLQYIDNDGIKDTLTVVGYDVVNDLAILKHSKPSGLYFELDNSELKKGTKLYSFGNPKDLGMSIIEGTFNGLLKKRRIENIFFSGSINPGMSGGPTLNSAGKVIGINVATSGDETGFLVPVKFLEFLIKNVEEQGVFDLEDYNIIIEQQLYDYQNGYMTELLEMEWETEEFGNTMILKKLTEYFHEWGNVNTDPDDLYDVNYSGSRTKDYIYVSSDLSIGNISMRYILLEADDLNLMQFYNLYKLRYFRYLSPGGGVEEEHSNYEIKNDFVKISNEDFKTMLAVRQYKKYPRLYDLVFNAVLVGNETKGVVLKLSLSGVSKENGVAFLNKFLETFEWKN